MDMRRKGTLPPPPSFEPVPVTERAGKHWSGIKLGSIFK